MTQNLLVPQDISSENQALIIQWSDGHRGVYPFRDLRMKCLCANCVDEWTRENLVDPARIPMDIKPLSAHYVGTYALGISWSDGHSTGIFTFDHLREICGCSACREKADA